MPLFRPYCWFSPQNLTLYRFFLLTYVKKMLYYSFQKAGVKKTHRLCIAVTHFVAVTEIWKLTWTFVAWNLTQLWPSPNLTQLFCWPQVAWRYWENGEHKLQFILPISTCQRAGPKTAQQAKPLELALKTTRSPPGGPVGNHDQIERTVPSKAAKQRVLRTRDQ